VPRVNIYILHNDTMIQNIGQVLGNKQDTKT